MSLGYNRESTVPRVQQLPPVLFPALGEEGKKENNCVISHCVLSCRFYINFPIVLQEAEVSERVDDWPADTQLRI